MTDKARVVAIEGKRVLVVPLDIEVCLGCSNDQCRSEGSLFTVVNRRKLPIVIGSEVRVHAQAGRQLVQGMVSVGLPFVTGAFSYGALPLFTPIAASSVSHSGIAIAVALVTAAILARILHVGDAGYPEITTVVES